MVQTSCYSDEGVMDVKNVACDALLAHRVETKLKGSKINSVANRIHVSVPKARDDIVREPFIPDIVKERKQYDKNDPDRRILERDIEEREGGAGVYNINLRSELLVMNSVVPSLTLARRKLLIGKRGVEGGQDPRDYGWKEYCRLHRSRHCRKARGTRTGGRETPGRRILRQRRRYRM